MDWGTIGAVTGVLVVVVGSATRVLTTRIARIEKMLGNGEPGVFVRRDELEARTESADREHARFDREISELRERGERGQA